MREEKTKSFNPSQPAHGLSGIRYAAVYTALFAVFAVIGFAPFWRNGISLIYDVDGIGQYYPAFLYIGKWLRSLPSELIGNLAEGNLSLPVFDLQIAMGEDIIGCLNYYGFGDPLNLLAVFATQENGAYLFTFMYFLRLFLAGVSFLAYCSYMNLDRRAGLVCVFPWLFHGFTLSGGACYIEFLSPMIYFPLMLIGCEQIMRAALPGGPVNSREKSAGDSVRNSVVYRRSAAVAESAAAAESAAGTVRRPGILMHSILPAAVAYAGACGFYFLYMSLIGMLVYCCFRMLFLYGKRGGCWGRAILSGVWCSVMGLMLSAPILLPSIQAFLDSYRSNLNVLEVLTAFSNWLPSHESLQSFLRGRFVSSDTVYWRGIPILEFALLAAAVLLPLLQWLWSRVTTAASGVSNGSAFLHSGKKAESGAAAIHIPSARSVQCAAAVLLGLLAWCIPMVSIALSAFGVTYQRWEYMLQFLFCIVMTCTAEEILHLLKQARAAGKTVRHANHAPAGKSAENDGRAKSIPGCMENCTAQEDNADPVVKDREDRSFPAALSAWCQRRCLFFFTTRSESAVEGKHGSFVYVLAALTGILLLGNLLYNTFSLNTYWRGSFVAFADVEYYTGSPVTNSEVVEEDHSLYRISNDSLTDVNGRPENVAMLNDYNGVTFWWSIINENTQLLVNQLGGGNFGSYRSYGLNSSSIYLSLSGVKYHFRRLSDAAVPVGFRETEEVVYYDDSWVVYENEYALPLVYTSRNIISADDFTTYNALEKMDLLLDAVVLTNADEDILSDSAFSEEEGESHQDAASSSEEEAVSASVSVLSAEEQCTAASDDLLKREAENVTIISEENTLVLCYDMDLQEEAEIYLFIEHCEALNNVVAYEIEGRTGDYDCASSVDFLYGLGNCVDLEQFAVTVELAEGTDEDIIQEIIAAFRIYILTEDQLSQKLAAFGQEGIEVEESTNRYSVAVSQAKESWLVLSVPYSGNWRAYVDGEETEITQADTLYMAVYVPSGTHEVEFQYCNRALTFGLVLMGIALAAMVLLLIGRRPQPDRR